ncbi:unnamed protein product [marine sediment metagenome]|uniref:Uncharacterized protein n=1 Tax=marine sediment metagenome TaxID=412755 RepID=X1CAM5_9ZZZZ
MWDTAEALIRNFSKETYNNIKGRSWAMLFVPMLDAIKKHTKDERVRDDLFQKFVEALGTNPFIWMLCNEGGVNTFIARFLHDSSQFMNPSAFVIKELQDRLSKVDDLEHQLEDE